MPLPSRGREAAVGFQNPDREGGTKTKGRLMPAAALENYEIPALLHVYHCSRKAKRMFRSPYELLITMKLPEVTLPLATPLKCDVFGRL